MKTIIFECKTISPMFLNGADGKTPELRPPSIKGAMRFWWRAINGHLRLEDLKEEEGAIFGIGGTDAAASKFAITCSHHMELGERKPLPHKHFKDIAFIEDQNFAVKLIFRDGTDYQQIANVFILTSILGGLGKRVRRGMGSFKITNIKAEDTSGKNINLSFTDLSKFNSIEYINSLMKSMSKHYNLSNNEIYNNYSARMEAYPYIRVVYIVENTSKNILYKISQATHDTLHEVGKSDYAPNIGHADGSERFASPIYVSLIEKDRAIITELNTVPGRSEERLSFSIAEKLINRIVE